MWFRSEVEVGLLAPGFYGDVVGFRAASGNFVAGEVGDLGERETHFLDQRGSFLIQRLKFFLEPPGLIFQVSGRTEVPPRLLHP